MFIFTEFFFLNLIHTFTKSIQEFVSTLNRRCSIHGNSLSCADMKHLLMNAHTECVYVKSCVHVTQSNTYMRCRSRVRNNSNLLQTHTIRLTSPIKSKCTSHYQHINLLLYIENEN